MYRKNKYNALLKQPTRIFHTQDLSVLWGISNKNTLYTTIKRYCQRSILYHIHKGMYATVPMEDIDPFVLGIKAMHCFAYISCETVLTRAGVMNQVITDITIVSSQSKHFAIGPHSYRSRQLKDEFLYNSTGIETQGYIAIATVDRAIIDLLYFNPKAHFDAPVDWKQIQQLQRSNGYPVTTRS